jgi:alpha-beta hydrolase superfamily lysophospholipase
MKLAQKAVLSFVLATWALLLGVSAALAQEASIPGGETYREEEVAFYSGEIRLAGTLMTPKSAAPHPAVVFVQGSGPETRRRRRELASHFARSGIAALIYDKRGTGSSAGDWYTASLDDLATDALAAVDWLAERLDVDGQPGASTQIGLWGLSQGSWVVFLAASRSQEVAFVISASGAAMSPAEQELYRWGNVLNDLGYSERTRAVALQAVRLQFDLDRADLPLLDDLFPKLDFDYDPVPTIEQVTQPILALWGEEDQVVPPLASARALAQACARSGNQDCTLQVFADTNHSMHLEDEATVRQAYPPGYLRLMVTWVLDHAAGTWNNTGEQSMRVTDALLEELPATRLPWYGTALAQLSAIAFFALVFIFTVVSGAVGYVVRRIRGQAGEQNPEVRLAARGVSLVSLFDLALLARFVLILVRFMMVDEGAFKAYLEPPASGLTLLLSLAAAGLLGILMARAWRGKGWGGLGRVRLAAATLAAWAFVPFVLYWHPISP